MSTQIAITPRLLWGIQIDTNPGPSWVSIDVGKPTQPYGRRNAVYHIDTPEWEYTGADLSGVGGPEQMLDDLLCFLSTAAEAYRSSLQGDESDNGDLFPPQVMEWAYINDYAIQAAQCDLMGEPE